jgi:hypothetical protein
MLDRMRIIAEGISMSELRTLAESAFGSLVKAVVDLRQERMAVGGELHSDEEALLLEQGSRQEDLWGVNLYPDLSGDDFVEFDSMINLRPWQGNRSRAVEDPDTRKRILEVVRKLVQP